MYFLEINKKKCIKCHRCYLKKNDIFKLFFLYIKKKKYLKKYFLGLTLFYFIIISTKWKKLYKKIKNNNILFLTRAQNNIYAKLKTMQNKINGLVLFLVKYFFLIKSFGKITVSCFQMIFYYDQSFNRIKLKFDDCLVRRLYFFFKYQICNKKYLVKNIYQSFATKKNPVFTLPVKKFFGLFYLPDFQQILIFKTAKKIPMQVFFLFFYQERNRYIFFFKKISSFFILIKKYIGMCHLRFCSNQKKFCVLCQFVNFFFYRNIYTFIKYIKHQKYLANNLKCNSFFNSTKYKKYHEHFNNILFSKAKKKIVKKNLLLVSKYSSFLYTNKLIFIFRLFEIGTELHVLWFSLKICEFSFFVFKNISLNLDIFFLLKHKFLKVENKFFNFFFYSKQKILILKKNNLILKKISLEKSLNKRKFQKKLYEIKNMETDFVEILNNMNN